MAYTWAQKKEAMRELIDEYYAPPLREAGFISYKDEGFHWYRIKGELSRRCGCRFFLLLHRSFLMLGLVRSRFSPGSISRRPVLPGISTGFIAMEAIILPPQIIFQTLRLPKQYSENSLEETIRLLFTVMSETAR